MYNGCNISKNARHVFYCGLIRNVGNFNTFHWEKYLIKRWGVLNEISRSICQDLATGWYPTGCHCVVWCMQGICGATAPLPSPHVPQRPCPWISTHMFTLDAPSVYMFVCVCVFPQLWKAPSNPILKHLDLSDLIYQLISGSKSIKSEPRDPFCDHTIWCRVIRVILSIDSSLMLFNEWNRDTELSERGYIVLGQRLI